ncbi:MAG TPA: hypothetical protein VF406_06160 [Thermodesulfobacteriota bacterium]
MALTATYTIERSWIPWGPGAGLRHRVVKIGIPGSETYGTGLALDKGRLGCPTAIVDLAIVGADAPTGIIWKWDRDGGVLRAYEGDYAQAADAPLVELDSNDQPAAQDLLVEVKGY